MEKYTRAHPEFALCGLSCCLCPRYRTDGPSRCPGCGGADFSDKHPTCAVVTCAKKHGHFEFCFQCPEYPCQRYARPSDVDSFISYRKVLADFGSAAADLKKHLAALKKRSAALDVLLEKYNDGKSKGLYCQAVTLLPLSETEALMAQIAATVEPKPLTDKEKAKEAAELFRQKAESLGIDLALRKK